MTEKTKPKYSALQNVGWMLANAWRDCKSVPFLCAAIAAASVALNLTELFVAPRILQKVEQGASVPELLRTILLFAALLFALMGFKQYLEEGVIYGRITVRTGILVKVTAKANKTSYPNTLDGNVEKLKSKGYEALDGNREASEHIWTTLTALLTNLAGFAVYLALLSHLDAVLLATVIATTAVGYFVSRKMDAWRYEHRDEEADHNRKFGYLIRTSESVELAKDVRIFGLAPWLTELYADVVKLSEDFARRCEARRLFAGIVDVLLGAARNGIAYYYIIRMTLAEGLDASTFLLYFTAVSGFTAWITGILTECGALYRESLELNTIREYLEVPEPFRFDGGAPLPELRGGCELRLDHVSFRYPEAEEETIRDLCLTVSPGEKLAIVGLNGAGKTTLVKLLCGLLDPTEGRVLLNGRDVREFDRRDYYRAFSTVFQDFNVLDVSVAENVAQRIDGIDRARVDECLALAGLTEKVGELPNGADTKLGRDVWEDGVQLSGGQTQRLMLARALYRDAPILILDEPTAALDPLAESDIYTKYNEMTDGKTSLFVSHRLASTRFCDRVVFVADGGIAEEGTHDELLRKSGAYARLYEVQSRYYQEGRDF
ncbi:MAG: ABC transporter ATP-binding protein [Oscillospiraceae bacterium]|nr:ABC transporter ATP-binding protein [Oscillospiraceae bacterium]